MKKYRYGKVENIFGDEWYQVQVKRFGIWWNDEWFRTEESMMKYVDQLKECGNVVIEW